MQDKEKIAAFLADSTCMVVDVAQSSRSVVAKVLSELGAPLDNIIKAESGKQALNEIEQNQPKVIVSEYAVGEYFAADFIEKQQKYLSNPLERLFVLVTGNATESSVAEAAEEDVDTFICKPFTTGSLEKYLGDAIMQKATPSDYMRTVQEGKKYLGEENWEKAMEVFRSAIHLSSKPALAHYYLGFAYEQLKQDQEAIKNYDAGLAISPIHFKCLSAKFDLLNSKNHINEAYEVLQKLTANFPVSPQRLDRMFKLAIHTKNFEDIKKYNNLFFDLNFRPPYLVKTVSSGLVIVGKFLLRENRDQEAADLFRKAVLADPGNVNVLGKVIETAVEFEKYDIGEQYLLKYPDTEKESPYFMLLDFLCKIPTINDAKTIEEGRKLLKANVTDKRVFSILIRAAENMGKPNWADEFKVEAIRCFPEMKEEFGTS